MHVEEELDCPEGTLEDFFEKNPLPKISKAYSFFETAFFLVSNERMESHFFDRFKDRYQLDGYIVGCGGSTIWTMVEAFLSPSVPKGMIIVDVDPRIICYSKLLVRLIKQYPDFKELIREFEAIQKRGWRLTLEAIIADEKEMALKSQWINWLDRSYLKGCDGDFSWLVDGLSGHTFNQVILRNERISVLALMKKNYRILHELAVNGNIVVLYRDIFDSALVSLIERLPGYKDSTSLLYLSNAVDHESNKSVFASDFISSCRFAKHLRKHILAPFIQLRPNPPHKLITIDTLLSLGYFLRAQEGAPAYSFYNLLF
jgi:hypothetical protein